MTGSSISGGKATTGVSRAVASTSCGSEAGSTTEVQVTEGHRVVRRRWLLGLLLRRRLLGGRRRLGGLLLDVRLLLRGSLLLRRLLGRGAPGLLGCGLAADLQQLGGPLDRDALDRVALAQ